MSARDAVGELERILRGGARPERILEVRFAQEEADALVRQLADQVARLGSRQPGDHKS